MKPINNAIALFWAIYLSAHLGIAPHRFSTRHQIQVESNQATAREPELILHSDASAAAIFEDGQLLRLNHPAPALLMEVVNAKNWTEVTQAFSQTDSLQDFLSQPNIETSPAWEFLNNQALQKPMPSLFHPRLQRNLINAINQALTDYEAIQEFRCIVPPFSPVPDISVVKISRLPTEDGPLQGAPDWLIEIRSPDQSRVVS